MRHGNKNRNITSMSIKLKLLTIFMGKLSIHNIQLYRRMNCESIKQSTSFELTAIIKCWSLHLITKQSIIFSCFVDLNMNYLVCNCQRSRRLYQLFNIREIRWQIQQFCWANYENHHLFWLILNKKFWTILNFTIHKQSSSSDELQVLVEN